MKNNNKKLITRHELHKLFKMNPTKILYILKGASVPRQYEIHSGRAVCYYNREQALEVLKKNTEEK